LVKKAAKYKQSPKGGGDESSQGIQLLKQSW